FIQALDNAGELRRIRASVSVDLEIAEVLRRVMYKNGPAILFENVQGYNIPVAGNLFGSQKRMQIALDEPDFEKLGTRITDLLNMQIPTRILEKVKSLPKLAELSGFSPKLVKSGPVKDVTDTATPSFSTLPVIKTWPKDAGRFITFGLILTKNPDTGIRNLGVYRMQLYDDHTAAMHWQIHKRGAMHFKRMAEQRKRIDLVKCETVDLEVPAQSEIVLEGYVDPKDVRMEGPFGDHTGYYTPPEPYPTFHLTGIMRKRDPTYLTTVVGKPILEDAYLGKVIERSFLPLIQVLQPEVVDIGFPAAGWFQGLAIISIKKRYPGQAKKVMFGLWGTGQLALTK